MNSIDKLEEAIFQLDIIKSFEERGWALYECEGQLLTTQDLQHIVELGRESRALKYHVRYVLLPWNQEDSNWQIVKELSEKVINEGRGPYFVEMERDEDDMIWPIARLLIDSVELDPPFLVLHIDRRMSNVKFPERYSLDDNAVKIHLSELWKIRKQLMMALR